MPKPNDVGVGTAIIIVNDKLEVLLGKRKGAHRAGHWCVPGGWIDRPDTESKVAVIREALEEADLIVDKCHHLDWTSEDHPEIGVRTVTLYHIATHEMWRGEPKVMEPNKCEEWGWFKISDYENLPKPLFPGLASMLSEAQYWLYDHT